MAKSIIHELLDVLLVLLLDVHHCDNFLKRASILALLVIWSFMKCYVTQTFLVELKLDDVLEVLLVVG